MTEELKHQGEPTERTEKKDAGYFFEKIKKIMLFCSEKLPQGWEASLEEKLNQIFEEWNGEDGGDQYDYKTIDLNDGTTFVIAPTGDIQLTKIGGQMDRERLIEASKEDGVEVKLSN